MAPRSPGAAACVALLLAGPLLMFVLASESAHLAAKRAKASVLATVSAAVWSADADGDAGGGGDRPLRRRSSPPRGDSAPPPPPTPPLPPNAAGDGDEDAPAGGSAAGDSDADAPAPPDAAWEGDSDAPAALPPECDAVPTPEAALAAADPVRDSLGPDLAPWRGGFTFSQVNATWARHTRRFPDLFHLIQVRNGSLYMLHRGDDQRCTKNCNGKLHLVRRELEAAVAAGRLRLPEGVAFVLNVGDESPCASADDCPGPMLSVIKHEGHRDVAVPSFPPPPVENWTVPWEEKRPRAFFRGTPFCHHHTLMGARPPRVTTCSRLVMTDLTRAHPDLFEATINQQYPAPGAETPGERVWPAAPGPVAVPRGGAAAAAFQMALALDGFSASHRLAPLLATNSVVLKQRSPWLEWYYRSLKPCVHLLEIFVADEGDAVGVARAVRARPALARALAANAQAFALAHLTAEAQAAYWQAVLDAYAKLYRPDG